MSTPETNINGNVESIGMPPISSDTTIHSPEMAPRKRGRPSNAEKAARDAQAKIDGANPTKQAEVKAKAKTAKAGRQYVEPNIDKLAKQLMGVHQIADKVVGKFTGIQCLALSEVEGYALAESIVAMAREFDVVVSGKTAAILQLGATAAMIYGPRFLMFAEMQKRMRAIDAQHAEVDNGVSADTAG